VHSRDSSSPFPSDQRHTAHQLSVTVVYPWHPLAGQVLVVCGRTTDRGTPSYLVALVDGTKAALPIWMTELAAAREAQIKDSAIPSVGGLKDLRALVDEVRESWARSEASITESTASGETP
jgi:hypothetical protein